MRDIRRPASVLWCRQRARIDAVRGESSVRERVKGAQDKHLWWIAQLVVATWPPGSGLSDAETGGEPEASKKEQSN